MARPPTAHALHVRWMVGRDLPAVLPIEAASFEYAWAEGDFLRALRQRNCIGMVAERGDAIIGYMVYELHPAHVRVLNFAVHPDHRRVGIGGLLVSKLVYKLCSHRREKLTLAVRESNTVAHLFFKAQRFTAARVLRGHCPITGEDAYQMEYVPTASEWDDFGGAPVNRIAVYE